MTRPCAPRRLPFLARLPSDELIKWGEVGRISGVRLE